MQRLFPILLCVLLVASCKNPPSLERDVFPEQASLEQDEAVHPRNSLEWWYATGWLQDDATGDTFGIEFVIFHFNLRGKTDRMLTNVAITDPKRQRFYFDHALSKEDELLKAALPLSLSVNNGECAGHLDGAAGNYQILGRGMADGTPFGYHLKLDSDKPVVMHGGGTGVEDYGGHAKAGYFSYTDLATTGTITIGDEVRNVSGKLWYDRQWNCGAVLQNGSTGWDWASITIDQTGDQLMLYRLRLEKGKNFFGGTLIKEDGSYAQLPPESISIVDAASWTSPHSKMTYPVGLKVDLPNQDLQLKLMSSIQDQELEIKILPGLKMHYWEGMCEVTGEQNGKALTGKAYLEITNPENRSN